MARLTRLLGEAGVDTHRGSTEMSLRREVARLRHLLHEALRLNDRLKGRCRHLRSAFKRTAAAKEGFKTRLRRATRSGSPVAADAELRKALRRSRRQKTALNALRKENARLRRTAKASQGRVGTLEAQLSKLRATAAVLSGTLYGRRSEKQQTPGTGRRRGQQPGAPGHGRTPRPGIEERVEVHNPPAGARVCAACGKPYVANGTDESSLLEIEVRGRWRRRCDCASSPMEVTASPVPRLFPNTPYGTSVWSRFLFEHYACLRPLHRVAAWLGEPGLPVAPGTLADSAPRFMPLFEPLARRSASTKTKLPCAMPTRRLGACRRCARRAVRPAPGCGPRSATTRSTSTSTCGVRIPIYINPASIRNSHPTPYFLCNLF